MSIEDKKACKAAYLEALRVSPIDREILKFLHKVNDNVLDKWLYVPDRYPTFRACYELWLLMRKQRMLVCPELNRLIALSVNRSSEATARMGTPVDKEGNPLAKTKGWIRSPNIYTYKGEMVSTTNLTSILNISRGYIDKCIRDKKIPVGGDVSFLESIKRDKPIGTPTENRKFLKNGVPTTIKQLSVELGLSPITIDNKLRLRKKSQGDEISDVDFSKYSASGPRRKNR